MASRPSLPMPHIGQPKAGEFQFYMHSTNRQLRVVSESTDLSGGTAQTSRRFAETEYRAARSFFLPTQTTVLIDRDSSVAALLDERARYANRIRKKRKETKDVQNVGRGRYLMMSIQLVDNWLPAQPAAPNPMPLQSVKRESLARWPA